MRILWYSNAPWVASGYGNQTALFVPRLQAMGHEVAVAAFHGLHGSPMAWNGIAVFPGSPEDMWAQDVLLGHYQKHNADLLITLMDQWVLDAGILRDYSSRGMRAVHWTPVDCEPLGKMDQRNLAATGNRPIAMSKFGERQLEAFNPLYVPHGVDTKIFQPLPEAREAIRERAKFDGKFIIGINSANQDPVRKGFGEQLAAFRLFHDKYPESRLLIHARRVSRSGSDLDRLVQVLHLEEDVEFGDQYMTTTGITKPEELANWYNVLDVFSNCSYGEGFGIPVMEAQACGTPVAVTSCSSLTEICGSGWLADGDFYWNAGHGAWWTKPFIRSIADCWEQALLATQDGSMAAMREKARGFALGYDADLITEKYWKPVLEQLSPAASVTLSEPRIWSPVMFRDETDMLKFRLDETGALIDKHIVIEAETTHRNVPKPLVYAKSGKKLAKYASKITRVTAELPGAEDPWVNEHAQRDAAWQIIDKDAADSDWVLISDVDEIPSSALLKQLRGGTLTSEAYAVRMNVYIHHARYRVPDEMVPPQCVVATVGYIRRHGGKLGAVRDARDSYPVLLNGGWHFSWFGGPEAAKVKLETATCHTELLTNGEGDLIADGTRYYTTQNGGGLPVVEVEIDDSLPDAFREGRVPAAWLGPKVEVPESAGLRVAMPDLYNQPMVNS